MHTELTAANVASPRSKQEHTLDSTLLRSKASGSLWAQREARAPNGSLNNTRGLSNHPPSVNARKPWHDQALEHQNSGASPTQSVGDPACLGPLSRGDGLWHHQSLPQPDCPYSSCLQHSPHPFCHVEFILGVLTCSSGTGRKLAFNTFLSRGISPLKLFGLCS